MTRQWIIQPASPDLTSVSQRWGVAPIVAQMLLNRGLSTDEHASVFLSPQLRNLHPPHELPGATLAAARMVEAVRARAKIVLYGDYDVDGTTGVAILWHVLTAAGADVSFYVPHRVDEGYGLNLEAVNRLIESGARMIITVDCGITAVEVARRVAQTDVQLIVTDHHTPPSTLPEADVLVHPGLADGYANPDLCGAGVAFKLAWAFAQALSGGERVDPAFRDLLMTMLPLAALGTIADVVPLRGENRTIARHGLAQLLDTPLPGLRSLMASAGLTGDRVSGYDVGFRLAPRINAAGRMGHARLAVELLTRADDDRAREIALYLEDHNRTRQATERKIVKQAVETIEQHGLANDARRAIVVAGEGWHAGVIGIVSARLVDRYHRPAVTISLSNGEGQGSARSIRPFDLGDALAACEEHLISYGGHKMAAGLRIASDRVDAFTEAFVEVANNRLTGNDLVEKLRIDAEISLAEMTMETTEAIVGLGPFGAGNPKPTLASGWMELASEPRCVGSRQDHLQATFREQGLVIRAIGFGLGTHLEDLKQHRRCRLAFEPIINEYQGRRSVEARLIDLVFPD